MVCDLLFGLTSCTFWIFLLQKERYIVTYNPSKGNIYALFKDQAKTDDILKAAFHVRLKTYIFYFIVIAGVSC